MLTEEEIQFYREKGYLGVDNVLSNEDVEELRRVTDEFIERSRTVAASDEIFDLEPDHSPENPRLRRIKNPSGQDPVFDRVQHHDGMLDIVAQLIGPAIRSMGTKLNMKAGESGSPVEWHQDWAFYPHTNDDLLAVGVAIDDMTRENGCLMVIRDPTRAKFTTTTKTVASSAQSPRKILTTATPNQWRSARAGFRSTTCGLCMVRCPMSPTSPVACC